MTVSVRFSAVGASFTSLIAREKAAATGVVSGKVGSLAVSEIE